MFFNISKVADISDRIWVKLIKKPISVGQHRVWWGQYGSGTNKEAGAEFEQAMEIKEDIEDGTWKEGDGAKEWLDY